MSKIHKIWDLKQDRKYMKDILYPAISKYIDDNVLPHAKVLDIGCNDYNAINKGLFVNKGANTGACAYNKIDYWIIDKFENKPITSDCDHFQKISLEDFAKIKNHHSSFDIIISIGVLGCYTLSDNEIMKYLESVKQLLKKDGIFVLHMPTKRTAANKYSDCTWYPMQKIMPFVNKLFTLTDALGISMQYTTSDGSITFNVLKLI